MEGVAEMKLIRISHRLRDLFDLVLMGRKQNRGLFHPNLNQVFLRRRIFDFAEDIGQIVRRDPNRFRDIPGRNIKGIVVMDKFFRRFDVAFLRIDIKA
jgi:hypothetical protein